MKKLVGLFLWFCAASLLAQICIIGLAASKGNVSRKTIAQIIGLLNGIDVQAERMKQALISSREAPIPTTQEVLAAKTNAMLQLDSRSRSLDILQRQIADQQRDLEKRTEDFDERRLLFEKKVEQTQSGSLLDRLKENQKLLENMSPESAKKQLALMLEKGELANVVSIIQGFPADKQKKVLAEFTQPVEEEMIAKVLSEIRNGAVAPAAEDNQKPKQP